MAVDRNAQALAFKATVEEKIRNLVAEFAEGKISREQFHAIYARYSSQLSIANQALVSGNPDAVSIAQGGPPTIAMRDALMGKAIGLLIYHHRSGTVLETLGNFEMPVTRIAPILNDFTLMLDSGRHIDHRVEKMDESQWLLFTPRHVTTIVTLFRHEPAQAQIREIERLHHDFEMANAGLDRETVDADKLAYPFLVFVKKTLKK
ncbi:hypothetical protein HC928_22470 [bacterium]|nr:hypothetical protein [bacterium]